MTKPLSFHRFTWQGADDHPFISDTIPTTMTFTPVNELERLLISAATDPAARPAFYRAITQHELFVITEGEPDGREGPFIADENTSFKIRKIEMGGKLYTPIFTSSERISAIVPQTVQYVAFKGEDLLSMFRGQDLALNPGADYGKLLLAGEIESILNGSIFQPQEEIEVKGGQNILLGEPEVYPHHLVDTLKRYFAGSRTVEAAYLAQAFLPDVDQAPHTLIGLVMNGDWKKMIEDAGVVVREVAKPGEVVDFVQIDRRAKETVGEFMQQHTKPFYVRKKWLGLF